MNFKYKGESIDFELIRRKRKSLCIKMDLNGNVQVVAPMKLSNQYILNFIYQKAEWIIAKKKEMKLISNRKIKREFKDGSTFMYLGKEYPIHLAFDKETKNILVNFIDKNTDINPKNYEGFVIVTNTNDYEKLKKALEKWYRERTLNIIKKRIIHYESNFKDKITKVTVKEQKRRYASINIKNETFFNWRISMAPIEVIDYIVVHEMCHMDFRNHSKDFWTRVEEIMPNYKVYHEYLKRNGINITID
ncbi:M48 family metallopeptidase [Clostridium weizhouense]|uniref:M48 family metallopeptidase n=1 Tax=Clostridium weizhouense TaxID=2859781 RepID=A0ABS7ASJ6_9CLOT|nr:SprT family zinc-dependent metalloprotease [Clostridium weizhouense]MBW6410626.1 M48 family metallopeptidase [Clostridium weizhouense]